MDIEYHFHMTFIIALRAGYDQNDAHLIAYSSQYTDDNNSKYKISPSTRNAYANYISQTMNITKPKKRLLRIYPMFHFFPGTKDEIVNLAPTRKDGKLHLLNTIPGNSNARALMEDAMNSDNLYRIGIATHMLSDTWCHQNFVGCKDSFNGMAGLFRKVMPDVGHADAGHSPDIPGHIWHDKRLTSAHNKIDNTERILDAAGEIFSIFCKRDPSLRTQTINGRKQELRGELAEAIGARRKEKRRISNYKSLLGDQFIEYDKTAWFREAVNTHQDDQNDTSDPTYTWKRGYKDTHWFGFQEAIKSHQACAEEILAQTFECMEIPNL